MQKKSDFLLEGLGIFLYLCSRKHLNHDNQVTVITKLS